MASLNAIMVDGTGMCGACRVSVGGKIKFVCVEGPEFNAYDVDFDELLMRLGGYKNEEEKRYKNEVENLKAGNNMSEIQIIITKDLRDQEWRKELKKRIPAKERTAIQRMRMPEVEPSERVKSNVEVNSGIMLKWP